MTLHVDRQSVEPLFTNGLLDVQNITSGRYRVNSPGECQVQANGPAVSRQLWFESGNLPHELIKRINGLQLVTLSQGTGSVDEPERGNWTWFEISVTTGKGIYRWLSHEDPFLANEHMWREGKYFYRDHELWKLLPENCSIQVHLCARFQNWNSTALTAKLLFDIGCEPAQFTNYNLVPEPLIFFDSPIVLATATNSGFPNRLLGAYAERPVKVNEALTKIGESVPGDSDPEHQQILQDLAEVIYTSPNLGSTPVCIWEVQSAAVFSALLTVSTMNEELRDFGSRLLVTIDANNLRKNPDNVSRLSWERTVEDLLRGANRAEELNWQWDEKPPFHVVIRLGYEGAIYIGPKSKELVLVLEPKAAEGDFLRSCSNYPKPESLPDYMKTGFISGLTASLAKESSQSLRTLCQTQIKEAIVTGLKWSRRVALVRKQLLEPTRNKIQLDTQFDPLLVSVSLKMEEIKTEGSFIFGALPYQPFWYIAKDIAKKGQQDSLQLVPNANFESLFTVDRNEVDGFRKIANSIENYLSGSSEATRPLSIAVFGQPGSGKSFGVKQVIKYIMKSLKERQPGRGSIKDKEEKTFNLSQFQSESDLKAAFETIRDLLMMGKLPVIFFDEFDSTFKQQPLYWLKHLLPVMESNSPLLGNKGRLLGQAIYIFIGGTSSTFSNFVDPHNNRGPNLVLNVLPNTVATHNSGLHTDNNIPKGYESVVKWFQNERFAGVNQVYRTVDISSLKDYSELQTFLYQIREDTCSGHLPIVFFEQFDANLGSESLGWLKYFLAPMQDGEFFDNGADRPLGRAIFIFVGGVSQPLMDFFNAVDPSKAATESLKNAKGPDFVSRLRGCVHETAAELNLDAFDTVVHSYMKRSKESKPLSLAVLRDPRGHFERMLSGYVDILGPKVRQTQVDGRDMSIMRRATVLKSMLPNFTQNVEGENQIGYDYLYALLHVPSFHHGLRSMEAILAMSGTENGELKLPCDDQLRLHVDPSSFHAMKDRYNETGAIGGGDLNHQEVKFLQLRAGFSILDAI